MAFLKKASEWVYIVVVVVVVVEYIPATKFSLCDLNLFIIQFKYGLCEIYCG